MTTTNKEFKASDINQHDDDYDSDELKHYCHSDGDIILILIHFWSK